MKRLLITGAGGGLGRMARERLVHTADILRLSDVVDLGAAAANEELVPCDLTDKAAVSDLVAGCDGIVHFGGQSIEAPWSRVRSSNIDAMFNLYEAAREHGQPRIVYASSNHAIGYHSVGDTLDANSLTRPDSLYGVSKVFGEALASMYFDKFGQETAIVRIGSCFPKPKNHRMLATWFSYADFVRLIEAVFAAPKLGCPIIYGVSNNPESWWDNSAVDYLGWTPQDSAEDYRAEIEATMERPAPDSVEEVFQGGQFCAEPIHEET